MNIITKSEQETKKFAAQIARKYSKKIKVFALRGDLGAGKTIFVQGFAQALGIKERIISPTFILIRQHLLPDQENCFYHLDLYRMQGKVDPKKIGLDEIWKNQKNIVMIEWAEKLVKLPKNTAVITLKKLSRDNRQITLNLPQL